MAKKKRSYLFYNPDKFLPPEKKAWIENATIAHIGPIWLPLPRGDRNYGGVEDVVLNNIQALENFGAKKQIIFGHPANKRLEYLLPRVKVYTPTHIPTSLDLLNLLRTDKASSDTLERTYVVQAYLKLKEIADEVTIIHDHTNHGRDHGIWFNSSVKPVVRTEHNSLTRPYNYPYEDIYFSQFTSRVGMGFMAISKNQRAHIPKMNWIGVNYNGVDLDDFSYSEEKSDFLLFLGKVARTKGTHNAIKVARRVGLPLIIAGAVESSPESVEYFEKEIAPYIDGTNVTHLENGVNGEERNELLSRARALLMLNEWDEPFGMVMVEALASGTPVVGFNRGSIPEIVKGSTGFVVETIREAAEATRKIMKGEYSSQKCRHRVEKYFSKEAMAARNIELYMKQENRFKRGSEPR